MPKFISVRTFKLEFLGTEWKDCFIKLSSVSIKESRELIQLKLGGKTPLEVTEITLKFLNNHFLSGNAYDSETKQVLALKPETLELLPSMIQEKMILFLVGDVSQ